MLWLMWSSFIVSGVTFGSISNKLQTKEKNETSLLKDTSELQCYAQVLTILLLE